MREIVDSWIDDYSHMVQQAHFKSVKPIRGGDPEIRPIGSKRRYKWCAIDMPDTNTVQAVLYGTPCGEYKRDGTVTLRLNKW